MSAHELQKSPKLSIDLVCMMEEIEDISPVLADTVMDAGYHAIDIQFSEVSSVMYNILNVMVFLMYGHSTLRMKSRDWLMLIQKELEVCLAAFLKGNIPMLMISRLLHSMIFLSGICGQSSLLYLV